jgi:hypothetical protein
VLVERLLSSTDVNRRKVETFTSVVAKAKHRLAMIQQQASARSTFPKGTYAFVEDTFQRYASASSALADAMDPFMKIVSQIDRLQKDILADAKNTRGINLKYSGWAWWTSFFLFAFGWALGLVGKLYGVRETVSGK